jgi:hypothetical protein
LRKTSVSGSAKSFWLGELENVSLVTAYLRWSGGGEYLHDTPAYPFMPSPTFAHSPEGTIKQQARAFLHWRKQMKRRDG